MEGIWEEIGQEPALGVLHTGYVGDEAQGSPVAHAAYHRVQPNGFELVHVGLGADEMVAQEHHSLPAQLVGDVHHFPGQCGHLPALEGHEVLVFPGRNTVLVVVVPLVDDELGTEAVAHLLFKTLQDIGGDGGGIAVPVHIFLPLQLVKDERKLVEEGGIADHVHMGVVRDKVPQPLHGEFAGLGLAHIEGDLVFKAGPAVGDGVVHVHRIPNQVGQEAHRVVVEVHRRANDHAVRFSVIPPCLRREGLPRGAVHHFPPALDVVPRIHLQELTGNPLHQRDGQRPAHGGVKPGGNIALLHLVGIGLRPGVILPGGVIGGVDLGVHPFQSLWVVGAVAVPDGVRPPAVQKLQCLGHHVHVGGNGDPAEMLFIHA